MEDDFYNIITDLVDYYQRHFSENRAKIAEVLGVTEGYVRKIHSVNNNKHYSSKHLFLLSRHWNIDVSKLFPSEENMGLILRYQKMDIEGRKKILMKIESNLKRDDLFE